MQTRYNAAGQPIDSARKLLISKLSPTIAEKVISINERGLTSSEWMVYTDGTKRTRYSSVPTSNITAETVIADGFTLSQKDTSGITISTNRAYTEDGLLLSQTDGRGNTTTTITDTAGRPLVETDAAGHAITTVYCDCCDHPALVTDAMGNTTHYRYDLRGRKFAEWGASTLPAYFGYDDADNLVSLTTFRGTLEPNVDGEPSQNGECTSGGDETT